MLRAQQRAGALKKRRLLLHRTRGQRKGVGGAGAGDIADGCDVGEAATMVEDAVADALCATQRIFILLGAA